MLAAGAPLAVILLVTAVLGVGTGATMPTVLMQVQNAAEWRDVGAATGSLLFLRSMGGAFGSTVVGALLSARVTAGQHAAGVAQAVDLGALRRGGGVPGLDAARAALTGGFQLGFAVCLAVSLVAVLIAWRTADLPLRSGGLPKDLGH